MLTSTMTAPDCIVSITASVTIIGAGMFIDIVVEPGTKARSTLDQHLTASLDEVSSSRRCQRDSVLLILDLRDDSDFQGVSSGSAINVASAVLETP